MEVDKGPCRVLEQVALGRAGPKFPIAARSDAPMMIWPSVVSLGPSGYGNVVADYPALNIWFDSQGRDTRGFVLQCAPWNDAQDDRWW